MRFNASTLLRLAAYAGLAFLHLPLLFIALQAFNDTRTGESFPVAGLTLRWVRLALERKDIRDAIALSLSVATVATLIAMLLGTLTAAALNRKRFFGKNAFTTLLIMPIALPGIVTGIALLSAFKLMEVTPGFWTIAIGHATFCVVIVHNNVVARLRRLPDRLWEASMDLGADTLTTLRHIILPQLGTALLAGGILAFALSVDELIVTTFTAGQQQTLPLWMLEELIRPHQRPVTNVVAMVVVFVTFLPILFAYSLTRGGDEISGSGK